jgi:hypothetical protein
MLHTKVTMLFAHLPLLQKTNIAWLFFTRRPTKFGAFCWLSVAINARASYLKICMKLGHVELSLYIALSVVCNMTMFGRKYSANCLPEIQVFNSLIRVVS